MPPEHPSLFRLMLSSRSNSPPSFSDKQQAPPCYLEFFYVKAIALFVFPAISGLLPEIAAAQNRNGRILPTWIPKMRKTTAQSLEQSPQGPSLYIRSASRYEYTVQFFCKFRYLREISWWNQNCSFDRIVLETL